MGPPEHSVPEQPRGQPAGEQKLGFSGGEPPWRRGPQGTEIFGGGRWGACGNAAPCRTGPVLGRALKRQTSERPASPRKGGSEKSGGAPRDLGPRGGRARGDGNLGRSAGPLRRGTCYSSGPTSGDPPDEGVGRTSGRSALAIRSATESTPQVGSPTETRLHRAEGRKAAGGTVSALSRPRRNPEAPGT